MGATSAADGVKRLDGLKRLHAMRAWRRLPPAAVSKRVSDTAAFPSLSCRAWADPPCRPGELPTRTTSCDVLLPIYPTLPSPPKNVPEIPNIYNWWGDRPVKKYMKLLLIWLSSIKYFSTNSKGNKQKSE